MDKLEALDKIRIINEVHIREANSEDGDKYLSSSGYALEAIDSVLNGIDSSIVRIFLEAA